MEGEFIMKSFSEIFFNEITFEGFLEFYGDYLEKFRKGIIDHSEHFKARYDYFFILNDFEKKDLEKIIRQKKIQFKNKNNFYNKEQFLIFEGLKSFLDEIEDYLESFRKGKAYLIEEKNNFYFHHFELSYNITSGKTIVVSNKNSPQLNYYLKEIKRVINDNLNEISSIQNTSSSYTNPYDYDTILLNVKQLIDKMDVKGWKYLFESEEDYNYFASLLANYFLTGELVNLDKIIPVKKRTHTKTGYMLNTIYQKLGAKTLSSDENYLKLARVLSTFKDFSLEKTYRVIQKGKQNF